MRGLLSIGRRSFSALLVSMFLFPGISFSANQTSIRSETLVRFLERDTATKQDAMVVPAYQYLQCDLGGQTLTFHANGWGRLDLTDNDYFADQTAGELLYGYLQYRPEGQSYTLRLGRQSISAGITNESVDGIYVVGSLASAMSFSAYFGQPVALDSTNGRDGDAIYGGRVSIRNRNLDLGISYKLIENDSTDAEEMAGIDYAIVLGNLFLNGLSSYNLITEDFGEHSIDAVITSSANRFRLFYQLYSFEDYFGTGANNANPFRVLAQTSEELSSYGLEMTRQGSQSIEFSLKLTRNDYDLEEASHYAAIMANRYGNTASYGMEFGISEGQNGRNDMIIARGYITSQIGQNKILDQISLDLLFAAYDEPVFGEDTSLYASVAGSRKLSNRLNLKLSADYESNPYYDEDIRGLVALVYNYSTN